ncbi:hypothetical protein [Streptomyces sp. HUAS TT7]|uniref:hypothetical protein n=1 Tax=Streptomyces sp. HUAS TT7 TaxID=3447507 RepID=UPI003F657E43
MSKALQHLVAARLIIDRRPGRYQLNPMVSGYRFPEEQERAIRDLPADLRLDIGHFEEEYELRLAEQTAEKARKAARRTSKVVNIASVKREPANDS